ncbi:MAG TPA: aminoacyl-tRNA hydrolase [Microbacteriaceae bacterium]|nr:aminoacyl-tRNA hydrolase [Microbacteriaceae bacterium]
MADTWLVAGLGNPGPGYAGNRHNVGFMVADRLAETVGAKWSASKASALTAEGFVRPGGPKLLLVKPQTFMNESGRSVGLLASFFGLPPERVIAIHDELDIPFDSIKLKQGGGHGGHNGLRSIDRALGTPEYFRVRVGIGRPPGRMDAAAFVLKDFAGPERDVLPNLVEDAADATLLLIESGLLAAQQRFHAPA